jgi:hypothetical protein
MSAQSTSQNKAVPIVGVRIPEASTRSLGGSNTDRPRLIILENSLARRGRKSKLSSASEPYYRRGNDARSASIRRCECRWYVQSTGQRQRPSNGSPCSHARCFMVRKERGPNARKLRVKMRNTCTEQMSSALPPRTDIVGSANEAKVVGWLGFRLPLAPAGRCSVSQTSDSQTVNFVRNVGVTFTRAISAGPDHGFGLLLSICPKRCLVTLSRA